MGDHNPNAVAGAIAGSHSGLFRLCKRYRLTTSLQFLPGHVFGAVAISAAIRSRGGAEPVDPGQTRNSASSWGHLTIPARPTRLECRPPRQNPPPQDRERITTGARPPHRPGFRRNFNEAFWVVGAWARSSVWGGGSGRPELCESPGRTRILVGQDRRSWLLARSMGCPRSPPAQIRAWPKSAPRSSSD